MSEELHSANPGKKLIRTVDGVDYQRIPVKTHLITNKDDYADVVVKYAKDKMQDGDILFCSEKSVACTQNRAIPMEDIKPRKLAVTLSRYVTKTPAGIGLGIPETMEMALQECGTPRILFAASWSRVGCCWEKPRMLAPKSLMSTMATGWPRARARRLAVPMGSSGVRTT